jgi:hypothetical protein
MPKPESQLTPFPDNKNSLLVTPGTSKPSFCFDQSKSPNFSGRLCALKTLSAYPFPLSPGSTSKTIRFPFFLSVISSTEPLS